jgi:hypothetical protein
VLSSTPPYRIGLRPRASVGNETYSYTLRLKITTKKSSLESVRQIIRQKLAKASGVRQPKKVDCKIIGMGAKSITIVRAVTADFVWDLSIDLIIPAALWLCGPIQILVQTTPENFLQVKGG